MLVVVRPNHIQKLAMVVYATGRLIDTKWPHVLAKALETRTTVDDISCTPCDEPFEEERSSNYSQPTLLRLSVWMMGAAFVKAV